MDILFVTPVYFRDKGKRGGGMENYIFRATAALKDCGHNVIIICGDSIDRVEDFEGIELHRVNCTMEKAGWSDKSYYRLSLLYREWKLQLEVHRVCGNRKIDIIQYAGHSGNGLFHSVKIPAVMRMSSHMGVSCFVTQEEKGMIPDLDFAAALERNAGKRVNAVYTPSRFLAQRFGSLIHRKVYVLPPPFENDVKKPDWSVYNKFLREKKYFLFTGIISPTKGSRVLKELIPRLLNRYPDRIFVAAGRCYSRDFTEMLTEEAKRKETGLERLVYLDELRHEQLYPVIQNAEVVINPTLADNLPNTCIEAMYFGRIVVGTDGTSCEQLIKDGVNGFLALPGDVQSTLDKVIQAVDLTEQQKDEMSKKAQEKIYHMRTDQTIKRLEKFYERTIAVCGRK